MGSVTVLHLQYDRTAKGKRAAFWSLFRAAIYELDAAQPILGRNRNTRAKDAATGCRHASSRGAAGSLRPSALRWIPPPLVHRRRSLGARCYP
jgi:hypothetical protein